MSDNASPGEDYVTLKEAADILGITRQHMRRLALALNLEAFTDIRDRRIKLFRRSDVEALRRPRPIPLRRESVEDDEGKELAA